LICVFLLLSFPWPVAIPTIIPDSNMQIRRNKQELSFCSMMDYFSTRIILYYCHNSIYNRPTYTSAGSAGRKI
jgi:hypothetical protein